MSCAFAFGSYLRRNARGVRNLACVRRPSSTIGSAIGGACSGRLFADWLSGYITRADDHRKNEFISSVYVFQKLDVTDRDLYFGAGSDVGHGLSEDVGTLLVEQARGLSGFPRGFVDCARLFAAFDFAFDGAVADDHRHIINGRRLRQGEDVDGFDLFLKRIVKLLGDGDAGERAADFGFDVGVFERAFGARLAVTAYRL